MYSNVLLVCDFSVTDEFGNMWMTHIASGLDSFNADQVYIKWLRVRSG